MVPRIAAISLFVVCPVIVDFTGTVAADYPERRILIIVPFATGGSNDAMARRLAPLLSKSLGQPVIVENRPGADGRIGIEAMAKAPPDGYTMLFSAGAITLIPALRRNVPYDPVRDIQPIAELGSAPYVIAVNPSVPAKNVRELIALAKSYPGKLNGSAAGNATQMALVLFQLRTGTKVEIIPYKSGGQSAVAAASGETDLVIINAPVISQFVASGRMRPLAVADEKRLSFLPHVPTTLEEKLDYIAGTLFGIYTVGGTPAGIVQRLNAEINKIIAMPDMLKILTQEGLNASSKSVEDARRKYLDDIEKWKDVVARARIPLDN